MSQPQLNPHSPTPVPVSAETQDEHATELKTSLSKPAPIYKRIWAQPEGKVGAILTGLVLLVCLLYTSPSPRDLSTSRMPSSA